jgi:hypothetical protein
MRTIARSGCEAVRMNGILTICHRTSTKIAEIEFSAFVDGEFVIWLGCLPTLGSTKKIRS